MDNNTNLEEEIKEIEEKLSEERKKNAIKNLKISSKVVKRVAPYLVSASIVTGCFKLAGLGIPFYNDSVKKSAEVKSEFDANGRLIKCERVYDGYDFEQKFNRLLFYTDWTKVNDKEYKREVYGFRINKNNLTNIISLLDNKDVKLEDIFGIPYMHVYESSYDMDDSKNEGSFVKIITYSKDKDDYMIVKQGMEENFPTSLSYSAIVSIIYVIIGIYRCNYSNFNYKYEIEDIKYRYRDINISKLKKELKKKKKELEK